MVDFIYCTLAGKGLIRKCTTKLRTNILAYLFKAL